MRSMPAVACGAFFPTPREFKSVVWPLALFLGFLDLGCVARDGDSGEDVFSAWGGKWRVSYGGAGTWQVINTSSLGVSDLRFGDFDGDGKTDVFAAWGGKWRVSFGGTGNWQVINNSNLGVADLRLGDFDGHC